MRFVNRASELARLDALVERGQQGLVALWGRRRVGKTRLLLEWSRRHDGLYSVADLSSAPVQRAYLADALSLRFPGFGEAAVIAAKEGDDFAPDLVDAAVAKPVGPEHAVGLVVAGEGFIGALACPTPGFAARNWNVAAAAS